MELKPGQESEVAKMIIEYCSQDQERSYQKFYGLLGERFCHLEEKWVENFDSAFQEQYATDVHRLKTNKL
uniref:MI domain-containing protein n=1 Tax=Amphimedon queenslandica TaxID=400682 RepID=A0A1X7TK52_AMPQE